MKHSPMVLVAGATNIEEADWLFSNGADEVYCGLADIANHRRDSMSIRSENEFFEIVDLAGKRRKKTLLLVNESWNPAEYPQVTERIRRRVAYGASGLVVKDLPILEYLVEHGVRSDYILSSLAMVFNSSSLDVFEEHGIARVILPSHLNLKETVEIVKNKHRIASEMFYSPSHFCKNVDPLCKFCDWSRRYKPCKISLQSEDGRFSMPRLDVSRQADIMHGGYKAGVRHWKIPRSSDFGGLKKSVAEARDLLSLLAGGISKDEFRAQYRKAHCSYNV